jgi:hypothetical protein
MDVALPEVAPLEAELTYPEHPDKILDQKDHVTRCKTIKFFKIQWSNHIEEEAPWESEDFLQSRHPDFASPLLGCVRLFATPISRPSSLKSWDEIFVRGEDYNTPSFHCRHFLVLYSASSHEYLGIENNGTWFKLNSSSNPLSLFRKPCQ